MTKTEHYQLNQWDAGDRVLREDFNEDNRKIEEALINGLKIITGTYTGDGAETRTISLEFTPRAIFVTPVDGKTFYVMSNSNSYYYHYFYGGFALAEYPLTATRNGESYEYLKITENGFRVMNQQLGTGSSQVQNLYTNYNNMEYRYIAIS